MNFIKVVAIIRPEKLEKVEDALKKLNVAGMSIAHIEGYGEYANFYRHDRLVQHLLIEVYTGKNRAKEIIEHIIDAAHTGTEGDGIVVTIPVNDIYHIRTKEKCGEEMC